MPSPRRKPTTKPVAVIEEPIVADAETPIVDNPKQEPTLETQEVEKGVVNVPRKFASNFSIDLDLDTEFTTVQGALVYRMYPEHYSVFPDVSYFDNHTTPFVSESFSIIPDPTFSHSKVYVFWDSRGIWVCVNLEKQERKIISEKIIKLVSVENQFNFLNNLNTKMSLAEFEQFKDYNKVQNG